MNNFEFQTVPRLINKTGAARELGNTIVAHFPACKHVLIVTDAGFLGTGLVSAVQTNIEAQGLRVSLYTEVLADPPEAVVLDAAARARALSVDLVVGLGGGSSMDVAKLIAVLAGGTQPLADMYGIGKVSGARLPLIQIPTTAGTGSEVTPIAIVTTGATSKMGVVAPQLYADLAILDAELSVGLPPAVSAATGIDAMVHAIEAYTTRHKKNPLSDMLARAALKLLWNNIEQVCSNGQNLAARQAMLLGAMLAGQAFANAPCAAVHALAYPLGGIFHVPHGLSNALVLPHVLRFNTEQASQQYAELAEIIAPDATGSAEARSNALISAFEELALRTAIPTRLRQVGVTEGELDRLASDAMLQTRLLTNNPREVSLADARAIYAAAW
ncbi:MULTISPECIES: iron-containing alcohol dehydrogenase [unclassified Undibacterium]|uniref:iron-containing alcohol dehydrogenase n=1 Tax=unclassified Undibacterium TaxID=2630295 RepID=UPI002AC9E9C8|nr:MULTISPECIES: iron-containing alcohol dehydrogenase [unclassified Undibacterium]MEB0137844.1 iron-containing alcohol dehydrogenase [Undibacterium sp. CCC2.1]MEB0170965.1 iron-containing alcohol dehydrogenase [Undibacterium sp. CCC1.1]MEB0175010.1 iron-containing alcohol dehydrogenase [Undibacterium sp. CCC3.4]MEB0215784.1 iron-containing alcohol dehydrogenase [Undibacterium sp. 5I2]WPX44816.1 iron-containing alcohol dehydrogenase [Undibacterium sp. CCC3.4]